MSNQPLTFKQFFAKYKDQLSFEYGEYRRRHDYAYGDAPMLHYTLESYARNDYEWGYLKQHELNHSKKD